MHMLMIHGTIAVVDKAPNPPWDVKAEQHSSKSIYLKWRAPRVNSNNNLNVLAYSVHYKPTQGRLLDELRFITVNLH